MLEDNFLVLLNCFTKRVTKHKLSVFVVTRFDKKPETTHQNQNLTRKNTTTNDEQ